MHNAGEVWANAVFECYVGILNEPRHSFTEARSRMRDYVIGGLKMTPANATFTEARDAILSVVLAADFEDYRACSDGFAKRGMGRDAVAPSRSSTDLVGVVEDYSEFVCKTDNGGTTGGNGGGTPDAGRFGASALGLNTLLLMLGLGLLGLARRMRSVPARSAVPQRRKPRFARGFLFQAGQYFLTETRPARMHAPECRATRP